MKKLIAKVDDAWIVGWATSLSIPLEKVRDIEYLSDLMVFVTAMSHVLGKNKELAALVMKKIIDEQQ